LIIKKERKRIKRWIMINRELTKREKEIFDMIRPTTFQDIVDTVRRDVEHSKYDAKRELRNLRNGTTNGVTNGTIKGAMNGDTHDVVGETNGRERINNIGREICDVSI
jgi:hypothetical protein